MSKIVKTLSTSKQVKQFLVMLLAHVEYSGMKTRNEDGWESSDGNGWESSDGMGGNSDRDRVGK